MLQFTQQQHDRQAKARMLAGLIKVNWIKALGMLGLFEDWAANSGRPGEVPEGRLDGPRAPQMLAALLEHRGDAETLATAFCELGILERTATGLKATGLEERYGPMFEAAAARSEAASKASKKRWENERNAKEQQAQSVSDAAACEPHAPGNADAMPLDAKGNGIEIEGKEKEEREQLELEPSENPGELSGPCGHPLETLWDELANPALPRWSKLTPERRRRADARWREHGPGGWRAIIDKVNAAPFLQGKKWFTLDWLLKPENLQKVLEGNYDDEPAPKPAQNRPGIGPPPVGNCAVCDELAEAAIGEGIFACYPHVGAFQASAEAAGWERPWEYAAEWVEAVKAQEDAA
jgi:hypothetical protein